MRAPFAALGLEQLVPSFHLAVLGILDLQPRCAAAVALVGSTRPLRHDALEIALAGRLLYEMQKQNQILELLTQHGYTRTHSWYHDDFYVHERPLTGR